VRLHSLLALVLGLGAAAPAAAQGRTTAEPADRWQITLKDGSNLWDLRLVKLSGDTLVFQGNDSILRFPLMRVDELRLVRKAIRSITPEAGRFGGVLDGADDEVYRLTLFDLNERRQVLQQILRAHPPVEQP
jgi:hypothetical protein